MLVGAATLLFGIGLLSIYSSSLHGGNFSNVQKNAIFFFIGILAMVLLSFFDWRVFRESSAAILILYFLSLLALAGVYWFGTDVRGVRIWYKLGPVSLDPIELVKPALLILLAKYFSSRHVAMYQIRHILLSGFYVLLPVSLIFFQPNLGACLVILAFWVGILVVAGIKLRHFLILILCFAVTFAAGWVFFLKDYQKARIMSFLVPYDPLGISWSQNQAKVAVGTGGWLGAGIGQGSQTQYGFLSEPQTDFIFSAIAEEMGLAGIAALLLLYLFVVWRVTLVAITAQDNFSRLFSSGVAIFLVAEALIHIGMNIGFLPIIGLPLPFVSYGGSSLIATLAVLGIVQAMKINPRAAAA